MAETDFGLPPLFYPINRYLKFSLNRPLIFTFVSNYGIIHYYGLFVSPVFMSAGAMNQAENTSEVIG